jgi:hypothetical protein
MDIETGIERLVRARERIERKVRELDRKIEHILFRMNEERGCMARKCPLDEFPDRKNHERDCWNLV